MTPEVAVFAALASLLVYIMGQFSTRLGGEA